MSDTHDLNVLNALIAAIRETDGAPAAAAEELAARARELGDAPAEPHAPSVIEAAREALGGLIGGGHAPVQEVATTGGVRRGAVLRGIHISSRQPRR